MTTREDILSLAEIEARAECARRDIDPDEICADGGITAWMVVDQERRHFAAAPTPPAAEAPAVAVLEGWKLVPIEPTDVIMAAGLYQSSHDATWADVYSMWKDMLAAVDEPPAAEAPGQEPDAWQHRIRVSQMDGGKVKVPFEWSDWTDWRDGKFGNPSLVGENLQFQERGLYAAPPTYADAEAKGFARGIETAAKWHDEQAQMRRSQAAEAQGRGDRSRPRHLISQAYSHDEDAAFIRSLASPAPKGET